MKPKDDAQLLRDLGLIDQKAPKGAFLMPAVNKFGSVHRRNREYKKRFSHAPHDRALLKDLRAKCKNLQVDNVELLEAHYLWEVRQFRKWNIRKHRLLRRFIRRYDSGFERYLKHVQKHAQWWDLDDRCKFEYDRLQIQHYDWPDGCEPYYHLSGILAVESMRAYGAALLAEETKTSFDPEPVPGLDTDQGGTGEGSSGGGGKRPVPKPNGTYEEDERPATFIIPLDVAPEFLPPWVSRRED